MLSRFIDSHVLVASLRACGDNSLVNQGEATRTLWFWFCSLFVTLVVSPSCVFSQDPHDYVLNLPYTAQVIGTSFEVSADGTRVRHEDRLVWRRDSQGRTRIENCDRKSDVVTLYIPMRHQFIQLFPGSKTASVMTYSVPVPTHWQSIGKTTTESLGRRVINGIYAEGTRITHLIPSDIGLPDMVYVSEDWVSPDLKLIVLHRATSTNTNPSSNETTEIRDLDRGEPDASLFEIPADYKVVTQPSK